MARLQILVPGGDPLAIVDIPVRITDLNYGNHLGNDAMVSVIHEARVQFLYQHGLSELDAGGTGLIMSDLAVQFKKEAFYGDRLQVRIFAADVGSVRFQLLYSIYTIRDGQQIQIALAQTTLVSYNYAARKVEAMSERMAAALKSA